MKSLSINIHMLFGDRVSLAINKVGVLLLCFFLFSAKKPEQKPPELGP